MDSDPASQPTMAVDPVAAGRWRARVLAGGVAPWLHGEVARRMAERLDVIRTVPQRILDWGGGDGASSALLHARYPQAQTMLCEPLPGAAGARSAAPVRPWWQRWRASAEPAWVAAGQLHGEPQVQLLWSNLHLHWTPDLAATLRQWHEMLAVDGFVMFSCYGPDTVRELDAVYAANGWGRARPAYIDMHDIGDALVHAGFADPVMDMERLTLTWPDAPALLAELRSLGPNAAVGRHAGLRTPRWRRRLHEELTAHLRDAEGRLRLSFEVVYGHTWRPPQRARVAAQTIIGEAQMRALLRRPPGREGP